MHNQPEAQNISVAETPLWAPGAPEFLRDFVSNRKGDVSVLEYGSGGSTIFLLSLGANVTTVEHHEQWADALLKKAEEMGLADRLTILRRDRPYSNVPSEFESSRKFDVLLVDGRERVACFRNSLPFLKSDGLALLDDSQRRRYWLAFKELAKFRSTTFMHRDRDTTIWNIGEECPSPFVLKQNAGDILSRDNSVPPNPTFKLVHEDILTSTQSENYVGKRKVSRLGPVEAELQRFRMIGKYSKFITPKAYELSGAVIRIHQGKKFLVRGSSVFVEKEGDFLPAENPPTPVDTIEFPGNSLDLTVAGAARYSFFLLDSLPKLAVLRALGRKLTDFDNIVVNSGAKWVRDLLDFAGDGSVGNLVFFNKNNPSLRLEKSLHIEGLRSNRATPRWIYQYIDEVFDPRGDPDAVFRADICHYLRESSNFSIL